MSTGIRHGLIFAVIGIILFSVLAFRGINTQKGAWGFLETLFLIGILIWAQQKYKSQGDGFMNYGEGLGIGFGLTSVGYVLISGFKYVYMKFIDPGFMSRIMEAQQEAMAKKGLSDEEIEQAMKFASVFTSPELLLLMGILGGVFFGMIVTLIVTLFTQRKNPQPF